MSTPNIIDGVALMAEAIRKEQEEKAKQENPPQPLNVSELTAQFATGAKPNAIDNQGAKEETKNEETKNESEDKKDGIN